VAEVRFKSAADLKKLHVLSRKLAPFYPNEVQQKARGVSVDFSAESAQFTDEDDLLRRSSANETEIAVIRSKAISISRLAPYAQWEEFRSRIERDLAIVLKSKPHRQIERVGLRYINRIDIPTEDGIALHEDYLNLHIQIPEVVERIGSYALMFDTLHNGFSVRVQSGRIEAPIPDTMAFLLDIDVFKTDGVPQDLPQTMLLLDTMREEKNLLFEAFISDAARRLFDNA